MPASEILSDIRIADMTTVIFGPYCTQTLADMGADVIKVEPIHGDDFRLVGKPSVTNGMGPCHLTLNRGKRSVAWDLKTDAGKLAIRRLIETSDIFIHNVREEAIGRVGLSYDEVRAIKPDIVYIHCTGFGSSGPYSGRPAYDDLIQGLSGTASLLPRVDGNSRPRFLPMAIADKVSGMHAAYATLAALRRRDQTGEAVHVEIPMFEAVTHFLLEEHLYGETFDPPNGPACYQRQVDPGRQPLQTADGWITIAPYIDARWIKLFDVFDAAKELDDERLNSPRGRYHNMAYMLERVQSHLNQKPTNHWLEVFAEADIPAAQVNDIDDLKSDPHLREVGFFQKRTHPTEGDYWETQPPVLFRDVPQRDIRPAPHIGQHSNELLAELGLLGQKEKAR